MAEGPATSAITIHAPRFAMDKPALWFAQVEAQFRIKGIVTELDKFSYTVSLIDTRIAAEVEDVINSPPATTPFQALKKGLVERFTKSRQANLLQRLDREKQGDRSPSQHLRYLKSLVPDIDEEVLKVMWLSQLPKAIQMGVAIQASDVTAEKLGEAADSLHEILQPSNVAPVSNVEQQIAALTRQVATLTARLSRDREKPSHSRSRSRSRSRTRKVVKDLCWYHKKFGKNAKNCSPGCTFSGNSN
ncbi:uncharacterized protein [Fopius arisanus]|uniref:DUF7041 domain-containing protein n=1 Tax=Fopius arisanus TaxID=64838 RepID=A0A9R1TLX9_9HYME|nr:PREDICTED: uncharacterized protein LOC105271820 [Fopius arisanus]